MSDKIEKKLPADILALIDEEAGNLNLSRQDAIKNLISVIYTRHDEIERERLKSESSFLNRILKQREEEILYLRDELKALNRSLPNIAESLTRKRDDENEVRERVDSINIEIRSLSDEQSRLKEEIRKKNNFQAYLNLFYFLAGFCTGSLIIYFIIFRLINT